MCRAPPVVTVGGYRSFVGHMPTPMSCNFPYDFLARDERTEFPYANHPPA